MPLATEYPNSPSAAVRRPRGVLGTGSLTSEICGCGRFAGGAGRLAA
jgi:hypothetical protein